MKTAVKVPRKDTFVLRTPRDLSQFVELNVAASDESILAVADRAELCWITVKRLMDGDTKEPRLTTAIKSLRAFGYEVTVRKSGMVEARG